MAKLFEAVVDGGHRAYCGPLAVARLTGVPVNHVEKMLRQKRRGGYRDRNGRKIPIRGTYASEITKVLERLGCRVTKMPIIENTIGRFIEDTKHIDATFLVNVTGHFLVAHKGTISDARLRPNRAVKRAWRVDAPAEPRYTAPAPKPTKPKLDIKVVRYNRILQRIKTWEAKAKRAETALQKLHRQRRYYERNNPRPDTPVGFYP